MNKDSMGFSNTDAYTLSIPNPCRENWERMGVTDQGRYCRNCNKHVIDLSASSDEDILALLNRSEDGICGRIYADQLNRVLIDRKEEVQAYSLYAKAAAFLLLLGIGASPLPAAVKTEKRQSLFSTAFRSGICAKQEKNLIGKDSLKNTIEGIALDSASSDPVPFAVVLAQVKELKFGANTDINGRFKINLPSELQGDSVSLRITFVGYLPFQINIAIKDLPYKVELRLRTNRQLNKITIRPTIMGYMVPLRTDTTPVVKSKPPLTFLQKLRHSFTRKKSPETDSTQ